MTEQPLRGWKEIAAFLGTSSRSAQRWERELGLPIQRLRNTTGSVVSAYPAERGAWRKGVAAELRREEAPGPAEAELDLDGSSTGETTGSLKLPGGIQVNIRWEAGPQSQ